MVKKGHLISFDKLADPFKWDWLLENARTTESFTCEEYDESAR